MRKLKLFSLTLSLIACVSILHAQSGGRNPYESLDLVTSARIASTGGDFAPVYDEDISLALSNPSLITKELDKQMCMSFVNYFSGIKMGFASYSHTIDKYGSFNIGMQFVNYGQFTYADETGATSGTFTGNDLALNVGWGRVLSPSFNIGSNLRLIYSALESYKSYGFGIDVAGTYHNDKGIAAMLIVKNAGRQLKAYIPGSAQSLPFEIEAGFSKKLDHVPFRFLLMADNLQRWNLAYEDPENPTTVVNPFTGESKTKSGISRFSDKLMRHVVVGGEFILTKNFNIRFGYNYLRRQDLKVLTHTGMVGFSWGFGFRISKFNISYGRATYHLSGAPNCITITTKLSDFIKAK